jgi:phage anti-repressor protein
MAALAIIFGCQQRNDSDRVRQCGESGLSVLDRAISLTSAREIDFVERQRLARGLAKKFFGVS